MTNTTEARIETSTVCNYRCNFCPHGLGLFKRKQEVMSQDLFEFIVNKIKIEAPQITDITISGFGEAFTDKNIDRKMLYAKQMGYNIHILTNGSLLDNEMLDFILKSIKPLDLRFSLHTINPATYSKMTGSTYSDYHTVINNINYAIRETENTRIIITAVIIDANKEEWHQLVKEYKDKIDLVEVWKPHNWLDILHYRQCEKTKKTCGRPFNGPLQIQVDGTVNMCCFDINNQLLLGDLKEQNLEEIFSSEPYISIRKHHQEGTIMQSDLPCKFCDQLCDYKEAVVFNSKFSPDARLNKTSTRYDNLLGAQNDKNINRHSKHF